jgi:hypothetical protein
MFEAAQEYAALRESFWGFVRGFGTGEHLRTARLRCQRLLQVCTPSAPAFLAGVTGEGAGNCYNAKGCCGSASPAEAALSTPASKAFVMVADNSDTHETRNS